MGQENVINCPLIQTQPNDENASALHPADAPSEIATTTVVEPNVLNLSDARQTCSAFVELHEQRIKEVYKKIYVSSLVEQEQEEEEAKPVRCSTQNALTICHSTLCMEHLSKHLFDIEFGSCGKAERRTTRS